MIDGLLGTIAPHYCYGCQKIGTLLCDNCKYDITSEEDFGCIACASDGGQAGVCTSCRLPYSRVWRVGERSGILQQLIGAHKFRYVRAAYLPMAQLLLERLDQLPSGTVLVPIPTVASHIRERGFDHTLLLAQHIAGRRGLKVERLLRRATNTKQRDADRGTRVKQAKAAFRLHGEVRSDIPYLLVDDVVTTGSTLRYAAQLIKTAGAQDVWAAVIARQPLD